MGRAIRRVPHDWQHPKNAQGHYIPLYEHSPYSPAELEDAITAGWLSPDATEIRGESVWSRHGVLCMPDWPAGERTHYQMYENTTEGTPISPVMESPEALAQWLVDNNASAFGDETASYQAWLAVIRQGWAVDAVYTPQTGLISGVAYEEYRRE